MLRKLVLKLACLHPKDQKSILAQMTRDERAVIDNLISEVEDLELNRDPVTVQSMLSDYVPLAPNHTQTISAKESSDMELNEYWMRIADPDEHAPDGAASLHDRTKIPPKLKVAVLKEVRKDIK